MGREKGKRKTSMAAEKGLSSSPISIGNCKVEVDGKSSVLESGENSLALSVLDKARINIYVDDQRQCVSRKSCNCAKSNAKFQDDGAGFFPPRSHAFLLLNPKVADDESKSLLQEVLKIYMKELPAMNYAANTGKKSSFLERCLSSGKYKTLILRSNSINSYEEVIAAVSYQIISTDTQYAEIPLAAVKSDYQKKGIGRLLYEELKERLQNVGTSEILCWGDKESEGFWLKQGFISIGEVNSKGRSRRLPIKPDIRRTLCFPGGSTLMISCLKKDTCMFYSPGHAVVCFSTEKCPSSPSKCDSPMLALVESRADGYVKCNSLDKNLDALDKIGQDQPQMLIKYGCFTDKSKVEDPTTGRNSVRFDMGLEDDGRDANETYSSVKGLKRCCEPSSSSLNSKRIRGAHITDNCQYITQHNVYDHEEENYASDKCSLSLLCYKCSRGEIPKDGTGLACVVTHAKGNNSIGDVPVSNKDYPKIMFMNIADETKKASLTKVVQDLGGTVTNDGIASTHVITGKARRTLNFCTALCSGAWIVSPKWLRESFQEGRFLGEDQFILEDEDYLLKHKCELKDAVLRAKAKPHSLLREYHVCLAKHIQPSVGVLSPIIKSAGGNVINKLGSIKEPSKTIFLACEEDMAEALAAAKKGIRTFSSDWFMNCVMKQELDLEGPQFAESL